MATQTVEEKIAPAAAAGGGKKKLIIIVVPAVLVLLGVVYFLFLKPSGPKVEPKPVPGVVKTLDPISINLAGGHFLKLGIALQPTVAAGEEVDGAKATDLAIALFSGKTVTELATKEGREKAKATLVKEVSEAYEKEVYDVYYTTFVYQ